MTICWHQCEKNRNFTIDLKYHNMIIEKILNKMNGNQIELNWFFFIGAVPHRIHKIQNNKKTLSFNKTSKSRSLSEALSALSLLL